MSSRSERGFGAMLCVVATLAFAQPSAAAPKGPSPKETHPKEAPHPKETPAPKEPEAANVAQARAEFLTATEHVKSSRWGEALAAFERSAAHRPHAITTYNIGACERALSRYTRARRTLKRAVEDSKGELPASFAEEAKQWLAEIDTLLVRVNVTLRPADAALLIDGAPLTRDGDSLVALGDGDVKNPGGSFKLVIDPGAHSFAITRTGFANAVVMKTFAPGAKQDVTLDLQSLPATIHIAANRPDAVVSVDDLDSGVAPIQITRPAGVYKVAVRKPGYVPYLATIKVAPGEQPSLQASLAEETKPLYKKFWFWAAATVVVAGAATLTYFLVRPDPERPEPNGGGLGWVVSVPNRGASSPRQ